MHRYLKLLNLEPGSAVGDPELELSSFDELFVMCSLWLTMVVVAAVFKLAVEMVVVLAAGPVVRPKLAMALALARAFNRLLVALKILK